MDNIHVEMMRQALVEAKAAFHKGEVPVGSIVVQHGEIIARAHNQVEELKDPSAHAELVSIRLATQALGDWRLIGATLYTTLEPCLMCAGAFFLSRISRVFWGAPDLRHGAHGSYLNVFEKTHPTHQVQIEGGILQEEAAILMRSFFKIQRARNRKKIKEV